MKITVDLEQVAELVMKGKDIFLTPKAEKSLLKLLDLQKKIDEAINTAKKLIEEQGIAHNENFTSIKGDKLKIMYRVYGAKYAIDSTRIADLPSEFYKVSTSYAPVTAKIEKFVDEKGSLPLGISERERSQQISISLAKEK